MAELIASGRIAEFILLIMVFEAIGLLALWYGAGIGVRPRSLVFNLTAGASLVLALYLALTGGSHYGLAAILIVALLAHVADLAIRWTRRPPS